MPKLNKQSIPPVQRALALQGGGALGAYQAGVFKCLYEKIKGSQNGDNKKDVPLFDIIVVSNKEGTERDVFNLYTIPS